MNGLWNEGRLLVSCYLAERRFNLGGGFFLTRKKSDAPLKINMEHNHGGLEDHFPFQMGDL